MTITKQRLESIRAAIACGRRPAVWFEDLLRYADEQAQRADASEPPDADIWGSGGVEECTKRDRLSGSEEPGASIVATGVRGFPDVERALRIGLGDVLHRAYGIDGSRVVVHLDDLSCLCELMGVDFEFQHTGRLIPLPLHISDDGQELTEDELGDA